MSPQSRLRAHCPEVKSLRVSPTSRLISSGGPYLVEVQIDLEGLAETLGAGERLHVGRVEEDPLLGALGLQPAAGDAEDRPIGLGIALLGDARAVVALAVAVHIHALGSLGDIHIVGPGLRRLLAELLQHVGPVVDHLEVAIEGDHVLLAGEGLGEIAEEGRHILLLQGLVGVNAGGQILEIAGGHVIHHPLRGEDRGIDAVGAAGPVGQQLLIQIREGHGNDIDLGARQLLEIGGPALQRLGDLGTGEGHDVDGDAVELPGRGRAIDPRAGKAEAKTRCQESPSPCCHLFPPDWAGVERRAAGSARPRQPRQIRACPGAMLI